MNKKCRAPVVRPPGCGIILDVPNARHYGRKGGRSTPPVYFYVEGSVHTYESLRSVLGVSKTTVEKRIQRLREKDLPFTWSNLGLKEGTPK